MFRHVVDVFISPQVKQRDVNPEQKVHEYDYSKLYGGNGTKFRTGLQILREMISRLPTEVIGTTAYWITKIERAVGPNILFWMERVQREDPDKFPLAEVRRDYNAFADLMQAAIDSTREYETVHKRPQAINPHPDPTAQGGRGQGGNEAERAQEQCADCTCARPTRMRGGRSLGISC